jgi:hypothetical protein
LQENDALIQLGQHLHHELPDLSSTFRISGGHA